MTYVIPSRYLHAATALTASLILAATSSVPGLGMASASAPQVLAGGAPTPAELALIPTAKVAAVPLMAQTAIIHRRRHHRHRRLQAKVDMIRTVETANAGSRSAPTRGAYFNAALYYDFEPNRLYTVNTSPHFLTAIMLRPGEKLVSKAAGDTVRWVLGETAEGGGASSQVVVMIKPVRADLRTNIILTTDQRIYILEAVSREGDAYTSVIAWNYPQEEMREAEAARIAKTAAVVSDAAIDHLNFGYIIKSSTKNLPWQPIRVFDDGLKTYIQFAHGLNASEAPPLFLVGPHNQAELVNYRLSGTYYVVDRLIDVAELRLGQSPQVVVRITRSVERS